MTTEEYMQLVERGAPEELIAQVEELDKEVAGLREKIMPWRLERKRLKWESKDLPSNAYIPRAEKQRERRTLSSQIEMAKAMIAHSRAKRLELLKPYIKSLNFFDLFNASENA